MSWQTELMRKRLLSYFNRGELACIERKNGPDEYERRKFTWQAFAAHIAESLELELDESEIKNFHRSLYAFLDHSPDKRRRLNKQHGDGHGLDERTNLTHVVYRSWVKRFLYLTDPNDPEFEEPVLPNGYLDENIHTYTNHDDIGPASMFSDYFGTLDFDAEIFAGNYINATPYYRNSRVNMTLSVVENSSYGFVDFAEIKEGAEKSNTEQNIMSGWIGFTKNYCIQMFMKDIKTGEPRLLTSLGLEAPGETSKEFSLYLSDHTQPTIIGTSTTHHSAIKEATENIGKKTTAMKKTSDT